MEKTATIHGLGYIWLMTMLLQVQLFMTKVDSIAIQLMEIYAIQTMALVAIYQADICALQVTKLVW